MNTAQGEPGDDVTERKASTENTTANTAKGKRLAVPGNKGDLFAATAWERAKRK